MLAATELLLLPYSGGEGKTLIHLLVEQFKSSSWAAFYSAVAFAKQSGNYQELLEAMVAFAAQGKLLNMTFGADSFGAEARGSQYEAIDTLLQHLSKTKTARLYLYREKSRTFHPKIYLFTNEAQARALVIVGSSNWSAGGFHDNIEANVLIHLDLSKADHKTCFDGLMACFVTYWQEPDAVT